MHTVCRNSFYVSQQLQGAGQLNEVMKKNRGPEYEQRNLHTMLTLLTVVEEQESNHNMA